MAVRRALTAAPPPGAPVDDDSAAGSSLVDYCARPQCGQEFRRAGGRGRRQAFCSEMCRRTAQNELRVLKARLTHFEELVSRLRLVVSSYGREEDADQAVAATGSKDGDAGQGARDAVQRVAGVLAFATDSPDPAMRELRSFHEAVTPFVLSRT